MTTDTLTLTKDSNFHYDSILNWMESCVNLYTFMYQNVKIVHK